MSNNLHDLLKKDTRNFKKKNYPKSSDSSRVVRSTGIEAVSTSLKAFIYKGFSHLLAKNTPIILGFRDRKILSNFKAYFCPIFVFFTIDRSSIFRLC